MSGRSCPRLAAQAGRKPNRLSPTLAAGTPGATRMAATGEEQPGSAGYGIALLVSLYVLWSFGRTDGVAMAEIANMLVVLGFPASLGAATARLVV